MNKLVPRFPKRRERRSKSEERKWMCMNMRRPPFDLLSRNLITHSLTHFPSFSLSLSASYFTQSSVTPSFTLSSPSSQFFPIIFPFSSLLLLHVSKDFTSLPKKERTSPSVFPSHLLLIKNVRLGDCKKKMEKLHFLRFTSDR